VPHLAVPRRLLIVALVALVSVGSTVGRGQESNTKSAQTSVDVWLALVDAERYGDSWDTAASIFRAALPRDAWLTAVQNARMPLGRLKSRAPNGAPSTAKPPRAPEGEYLVFQFSTVFEQRAAGETVTAFKEPDGSWRVTGYFVK
jgi:Protein of unknown function (DUF4019)